MKSSEIGNAKTIQALGLDICKGTYRLPSTPRLMGRLVNNLPKQERCSSIGLKGSFALKTKINDSFIR
jgi:hypothetical protein